MYIIMLLLKISSKGDYDPHTKNSIKMFENIKLRFRNDEYIF